jgi:hypothetical protein
MVPKQCPNRECRQRLVLKGDEDGLGKTGKVGASSGVSGVRDRVREHGRAKRVGAVLGSLDSPQSDAGTVGDSARKDSGRERKVKGQGMTAEQYMKLSNSEKLKAQREGKF